MKRTFSVPIVPTWVRLAMVALAVPSVATGLWAVVAPQGFFDGFPGVDPRLVAAEPPFNEHLVTDAGAGLLASGVVLVLAAIFADSRSVRLGLLAHATFAIPHAFWHTVNPSEPLTTGENIQNAATLLFDVGVVVVLYVVVSRIDLGTSSETDVATRAVVEA